MIDPFDISHIDRLKTKKAQLAALKEHYGFMVAGARRTAQQLLDARAEIKSIRELYEAKEKAMEARIRQEMCEHKANTMSVDEVNYEGALEITKTCDRCGLTERRSVSKLPVHTILDIWDFNK